MSFIAVSINGDRAGSMQRCHESKNAKTSLILNS
jgi:hypothetical protein